MRKPRDSSLDWLLANAAMKLLALSAIMKVENIENGIDFPPFNIPIRRYLAGHRRAMAIVMPAMGTTASFYQPFAEELGTRGFSVLVPELPGTGESRPRPSWKVDYGYRDLVETYLPQLVKSAREIGQTVPLVLMGHSLGAHAGTLAVATASIEVDALVTIAGGNIHYLNWSGVGALKVLFAASLFSTLSRLFGQMPGQYFGFGGPQARTLIRQWSRIIFTGQYSHIYNDLKAGGSVPSLCIGYQGDELAPEESVAGLAAVLNSDIEISPVSWPGNPHSSWARNPVESVDFIENWLARNNVISQQ